MGAGPTPRVQSRAQAPVRLCRFDALVSGQGRRFNVDGHRIAVVRIDQDVYAVGDCCTHQNVSLSEGEVHPETAQIECVRHGSTFSLVTGEALSLPATKPTPVYRVEVVDGDVYLEVGP